LIYKNIAVIPADAGIQKIRHDEFGLIKISSLLTFQNPSHYIGRVFSVGLKKQYRII